MYNIHLFFSRKRLIHYYLLKDYLCDDLIRKVNDMIIPSIHIKKYICKEILYKYDFILQKKNIYTESWSFSQESRKLEARLNNKTNNIIERRSKYYYSKYLLPFLRDHGDNCECLERIDYPRNIYLFLKKSNKKNGVNSKVTNEWFFFQYYLLNSQSYVNHIPCLIHLVESYGFTSSYERVTLIKKKTNYPYMINTKKELIELDRIWSKHLLI